MQNYLKHIPLSISKREKYKQMKVTSSKILSILVKIKTATLFQIEIKVCVVSHLLLFFKTTEPLKGRRTLPEEPPVQVLW